MPTLKRIAMQTVSGMLNHLPIIHMPTFRLQDMSPPVSFSLVVVGSPRHSSIAGDISRKLLGPGMAAQLKAMDIQDWKKGMGVIAPEASDSQIELIEDSPTEEEKQFEDKKPVCIRFVSDMRSLFLTVLFTCR